MTRYQEANESAMKHIRFAIKNIPTPIDYIKRKPDVFLSRHYIKLETYYKKGTEIEVTNPSGACWYYFQAIKSADRLVAEHCSNPKDALNRDLSKAIKNINNISKKYKYLKSKGIQPKKPDDVPEIATESYYEAAVRYYSNI